MRPSFTRFSFVSGCVLALVALAGVLSVAGLRTHSALAAVNISPGVHITSGCEGESFFALWRQAHDQPVYFDSGQPPFSAAYFNWLFYQSYGVITPASPAPEDAAGLIRNARLFTLAGALGGAFALGAFAWRLTARQPLPARLTALAVAAFVFLGPLPGWWIVTVRPDLWATAFECIGLLVVLSWWRDLPVRAAVIAALCFFTAWSFKHNYIQGLGVALLFLVSHRQWRAVFLLLGVSITGWAITLVSLGADYRASLLYSATASDFVLDVGWQNFTGAALRSLPMILAAACLPFLRRSPDEPALNRDCLRLALLALPLSLAFSFATSCKHGAAMNYFLTPVLFVTVLALVALGRKTPVALICLPILALSVAVILTGRVHLHPENLETSQLRWELWKNASSPRYSSDQLLNLPWLNPGAPVYLTAFNYHDDRARGRTFAGDGIGGRIRTGYFASLLLPDYITDTYDQASLSLYKRGASVAGMTLWSRSTPPPNP